MAKRKNQKKKVADEERGLTTVERGQLQLCEDRIAVGQATFREVGAALAEIRDGRLYRDGHETFEAYCQKRWDMAARYANRQMGAAWVAVHLSAITDETEQIRAHGPGQDGQDATIFAPENERQARPLTELRNDAGEIDMEQVGEAWHQVVEEAPADDAGRPKVTEKLVRAVVKRRQKPEGPEAEGPEKVVTGGEVLDGLKQNVPPHLVEVFRSRTVFAGLLRTMSATLKDVEKLAEDDTLNRLLDWTGFRQQYRAAYDILKYGVPFTTCPFCGGEPSKSKKCEGCKGAGWVNKSLFQQAEKAT